MKNFTLLMAIMFLSASSFAQGKSKGHGNGKNKNNHVERRSNDQNEINEHQNNNDNVHNDNGNSGKSSKNQPAKVRDAFYRDYPNASNVTWTKNRGDWTATFGNGLYRSTAVYHANGDRRDTRTSIQRQDLPNGTIWDRIFRRDRVTPTGEYTRIERPNSVGDIFRMAVERATGQRQYLYYNANGQLVKYNY